MKQNLASPEMLAQAKCAVALMEEIREAQRASSKGIKGGAHLDSGIQTKIASEIAQSDLLSSLDGLSDIPPPLLHRAMERFEEIARRRRFEIPDELRPFIYNRLGVELMANTEAFRTDRLTHKKLLGVTIAHGNIADLPNRHIRNDPTQPTYGEFFARQTSVIPYVVMHNASDPAAFLDKAVDTIERLSKRYRRLPISRITEADILWAAILHPERADETLKSLYAQRKVNRDASLGKPDVSR